MSWSIIFIVWGIGWLFWSFLCGYYEEDGLMVFGVVWFMALPILLFWGLGIWLRGHKDGAE